jgi:uncharacterized protein YkwD
MILRRHPLLLPLLAIGLIVIAMTTQRASAATFHAGNNGTASISVRSFAAVRLAARKAALEKESHLSAAARLNAARRVRAKLVHAAAPRNPRSAASSSTSLAAASSKSSTSTNLTVAEVQAEILRLVNAERAKVGLAAYNINETLNESAQAYAENMEKLDCFSHTECGSTLKERMHASGYFAGGNHSYSYGENIAKGQDTAKEVMEDWMNSPPHKEAILSSDYLEIGIGKSGKYWVQHFGAIR